MKCFKCDKEILSGVPCGSFDPWACPINALIFKTTGNCGSTLYDDGPRPHRLAKYVEIIICDGCVRIAQKFAGDKIRGLYELEAINPPIVSKRPKRRLRLAEYVNVSKLTASDASILIEKLREGRENMSDVLNQYVIYNNPKDYPGKFVLRKWVINPAGLHSGPILGIADNIEEVRKYLPSYAVKLSVCENDDPVIAEVWV